VDADGCGDAAVADRWWAGAECDSASALLTREGRWRDALHLFDGAGDRDDAAAGADARAEGIRSAGGERVWEQRAVSRAAARGFGLADTWGADAAGVSGWAGHAGDIAVVGGA